MFNVLIQFSGSLRILNILKNGDETGKTFSSIIHNAGANIQEALSTAVEDALLYRDHVGNESFTQEIRIPKKGKLSNEKEVESSQPTSRS